MRRALVLLLASACALSAQSKKTEDLAQGAILVTTRPAADPLFAKSVILLAKYDSTGALGLMVNRPSTVRISEALKGVAGAADISDPVFVGGPVELDTVFALIHAARKPEGTAQVAGEIHLITGKPVLEKALAGAPKANGFRVYLGYCGWAPGQLQNEVKLGLWYIFNRSEDLAFDDHPATLWSRLIEKAEALRATNGYTPDGEARIADR